MGSYINLTLNLEFDFETPKEIINLFDKKIAGEKWNENDKKVIPFEYDIESIFETLTSSTYQCLNVFYFQKQEYQSIHSLKGLYYFHLSCTTKDGSFYQDGYFEMIIWLAQFSPNDRYIGEFHKEESKTVNLLFCESGIVTMKPVKFGKEDVFKLLASDFDMKKPD